MRLRIIAGNWKMHGTLRESADLAGGVRRQLEVVVCPPFPFLYVVRDALDGSKVPLGAQDCHGEAKGAFTGEVSPAMVRERAGLRCIQAGLAAFEHLRRMDERKRGYDFSSTALR